MKTETFSGTIESAWGKPVSPVIKFSGEYQAYESVSEVRNSNDLPSDDEVLTFVNNKRKANARQKVMQAALVAAGYEKPTLEDPEVQVATIVKALIASGKFTQEQAEQQARATLGL